MMSHCGYFSHARSKGEKLGYYRASVACGHCRKRKARCMPAVGDPQGRCSNCVRLGRQCVAVKVEVMEALDILGEDETPENILQVQRLIGHVKTEPPVVSHRQRKSRSNHLRTAKSKSAALDDHLIPAHQSSQAFERPEQWQQFALTTSSAQDCTLPAGNFAYSDPALVVPRTLSSLWTTESTTMNNACCTDMAEYSSGVGGPVPHPSQVYRPEPLQTTDLECENSAQPLANVRSTGHASDWQFMTSTMNNFPPFPATDTAYRKIDRQQCLGQNVTLKAHLASTDHHTAARFPATPEPREH
ncbi:hypothetical protein PV11_05992 [Exophiala sideris]|uniref:Zn(2)-C6 fungal-type domain-containing protein n=1 Tax=Exophiala sideris TaxID=1016849 RepID=A0A0D1X8A2_9EURO|nr:hypothetical protein PV11_05992 [Exophiala sideris]